MSIEATLPEDWKYVRLGEVGNLINGDRGKNYPSQKDFVNDGIPFINAGHIQNGDLDFGSMNFISRQRFDLLGSGKVNPGDILYCLRGSLGKTAIIREIEEGAIASSLVIIRPSERIRTDYLYRFLASPMGQAEIYKYDNGSSQPNLSAKSVKEYKLPLPPIEEQRRIAAILDKADEVRRKRKEAIALTEELLRSVFLDMFGDPVTNPKGWNIGLVSEVSEFVTDGTHHTPERSDKGIYLLSARNIQEGYISLPEGVDFVPINEFERLCKRYRPKPIDVLISCSGSVGRVAVVRDFPDFSMVRSVAVVRPNIELLKSEFLESWLHTPYMKSMMKRGSKQSSQANLFQGAIKELPVIIPPYEIQEKWETRKNKVKLFASRFINMEQVHSDLFNSLLQRAFRGEL